MKNSLLDRKTSRMTNQYTREVLIKTIVAHEAQSIERGEEYLKELKDLYHKWEHVSSEDLCTKYNQLDALPKLTVDSLKP